jgi:hypothetical protein
MREVLGEELSDLFAKHLPPEKSFKQSGFERKSEVVRCFFDFLFLGKYLLLDPIANDSPLYVRQSSRTTVLRPL